MIRGYNFPSGTAEKVTIDGNKVTYPLDLYTHSYTLVETSLASKGGLKNSLYKAYKCVLNEELEPLIWETPYGFYDMEHRVVRSFPLCYDEIDEFIARIYDQRSTT